ncbi:hypothetical protein [Dactylosporangium sp. CA-233914]|uniref:hypothetical protein n=1 Tax=Dactylosporangium sp. CA-233914 TaxID=3239934 RepID=UPI003D8D947E
MELRAELCAVEVPPERYAELTAAAEDIVDRIADGEDVGAAIEAFNAATGHQYDAESFRLRCSDVDELVREAAQPVPVRVPGVSREELAEVVRRIRAVEGDTDYYLGVLEANVLDPRVSNLIFWPKPGFENATDLQIVDEALRYRPFVAGADGTVTR